MKKLSLAGLKNIATQQVVKQFAGKYHLVYFGRVDARSDEHIMVRGVTASTTHRDNHYTVGTFDGHDLMLLQRSNTLTFPGKPSTALSVMILQVDLNRTDLPHVFIDSMQHDETFYANLRVGFAHLQDVTNLLPRLGPVRIFAATPQLHLAQQLLTPELSVILQQFTHFDYEFSGDQLFVYSKVQVVTLPALTDMLRVGMLLAKQLDGTQ